MHKTRHWFAPQSLLEKTRKTFNTFLYDDGKNVDIPTIDCFMSGLAVFHLKYLALLQFKHARLDELRTRANLKALYGIERAPCDTQLRKRLDVKSTQPIRYAIKSHVNMLQRTKALEAMKFLDEYYLVSGDATGFYSSNSVKCNHCCTKIHSRGKDTEYTEYTHQMLVGSITLHFSFVLSKITTYSAVQK